MYCKVLVIAAFLHLGQVSSIKLNVEEAIILKDSTEDARVNACVEEYAAKLNAVEKDLGAPVLARHKTFDFASVGKRNGTSNNVFGVGFGNTATRSLSAAFKLMVGEGHGEHWGNTCKMLAEVMGQRGGPKLKHGDEKCKAKLAKLFPSEFKFDKANKFYMMDTPTAEVFLDLYRTFPGARFILTTRDPMGWAQKRGTNRPDHRHFAPMEEPCGYYLEDYTIPQRATLFESHNELVRCVVPKARLMEINVWKDSKEKMQNLGKTLPEFLKANGAKAFDVYPGSPDPKHVSFAKIQKQDTFLRIVAEDGEKGSCAATNAIMKNFQEDPISQASESDAKIQVVLSGTTERISISADNMFVLAQHAAESGCELDLHTEE